jgi:hypothetical protein
LKTLFLQPPIVTFKALSLSHSLTSEPILESEKTNKKVKPARLGHPQLSLFFLLPLPPIPIPNSPSSNPAPAFPTLPQIWDPPPPDPPPPATPRDPRDPATHPPSWRPSGGRSASSAAARAPPPPPPPPHPRSRQEGPRVKPGWGTRATLSWRGGCSPRACSTSRRRPPAGATTVAAWLDLGALALEACCLTF